MQRNTPLTSSPSHPLTLSPPHPIEDWEVFDLLTALVDKSLVVGEVDGPEVRYRMLESLREYAAEKLRAGGASEETADRHARYYAGAVAEKLGGASGASAAEREREYPWMLEEADNVRAALDRLWRIGETVRAATVTVSLRQFWTRNGWLREARANMDTAIARIEDLEDPALRARVLKDGGWFAFLLGDLTTAEDLNTRSIETAIAAGAADIHANALNTLALIAQSLHDPHRAEALFTEAIDMARTLGQPTVLADYLTNLGYLQSKLGRQEQAQALFAEARALNEAHGNESGMAAWLCNQSDAALRQNNWKEAQEYAEQSLERFRKIDNPLGIAYALANLADAASRQYLHALAEASIAEAVGICREIGHFDLLPNLFLTRARTRYTVGDARGAALLLTGTARLHALLQSAPEPSAHAESENLERGIRGMGAGDALDAACRQIAPLDLDQLTSQLLAEAWASMA
jgi:tetratricopeptide (TPR) repeat protein